MFSGFKTTEGLAMIRVAFTLIGGKNWTGGYNYLLNLVCALSEHASDRILPILFFGTDMDEKDVAPFEQIAGAVVIRNAVFNEVYKGKRLRKALLTGCDQMAAKAFAAQSIDVVFESAQFYGWRFPISTVAWFPDFQHRYLKHLFSFTSYWKREIGFRTQVLSGRQVMLSSEDARQDCEKFYPRAKGRTHVVRFAVPTTKSIDMTTARAVADVYALPELFFFLPNQFWTHKNHKCVIEALRILKLRGSEVVVAASGKQADPRDPQHFSRLKLLIEKYGLEENFRLLGLIPSAHIPALMRSCAALINPSTFEGWSTTVEEAKAMGTPMILSSLPVHKEQSKDAIFFAPDSPKQLAAILDEFSLTLSTERLIMDKPAVDPTFSNMKAFANKFVQLMSLSVKCK